MELYPGVVVDNDDPDKTGKVQVRIPELNGSDKSSLFDEDEELQWFEPCTPFFAGYQYGSLVIPPVGAIVWCLIDEVESGDPYCLYIGGSYGTGTKYGKSFGGKNVPKGKLETPKEMIDDYPDTSIIFKSLGGSVILIDADDTIVIKTKDNISVEISDTQVTLDAEKSRVRVQGDGNIRVDGDVTVDGNILYTGTISKI